MVATVATQHALALAAVRRRFPLLLLPLSCHHLAHWRLRRGESKKEKREQRQEGAAAAAAAAAASS